VNRVALLRGVNNVGSRRVAMADLRALFVKLGFAETKTVLNSGNILFKADRRSDAALERFFETETEKKFKLHVAYFIRAAEELDAIVEANPFSKEAKSDPSHLLIAFLKEAPPVGDVAAVKAKSKGRERLHVVGKHAYIYYPDGIAESKFRHSWDGTARNWNTVLKLTALLS
jgi:uncharacterized protein (DUF1697 family)